MMKTMAIGLFLGSLAWFGCRQGPAEPQIIGYVESENVVVAAPASGWLVDVPFSEGDAVVEGDVLFRLDDDQQIVLVAEAQARALEARAQIQDKSKGARREEIARLESQLEELKANLSLATSERKRWLALLDQGHTSKEQADKVIAEEETAKARVVTATRAIEIARLEARQDLLDAAVANEDAVKSALEDARWQLAQRQVVARVAGRVEDVVHFRGEFVTAGSPVLTILPPTAVKVRFFLHQGQLPKIALGDQIQVYADGLEQPILAKVSYIAQSAEFTPPVIYSAATRKKLVFLVEAKVAEWQGLHAGLPVEVRLP